MMGGIEERSAGHISWKMGSVLSIVLVVFIGFIASSAAAEQEQPAGIRASKLMDHPVINAKGEQILEIDDLILRRNGNVKRVVLSCCGFLGLGAKRVAVPFRNLQIKDDKIIYDITEEEFKQMASFNYANEEELYTEYYMARPGMERRRMPRMPYSPPYYPRYGAGPGSEYCDLEWFHSPGNILCSVVVGRPVINMQCQRIGVVDDLIVGLDGRVKEMVLAALHPDLAKDRVALPYKPFEVTFWGLAYDISAEELSDLPEFEYKDQ